MSEQNERLRFLRLLAEKYPTVQEASSEIINLQAILNLPKGTEHFMSDLHGEYEAFLHILSNASGAVREKVDLLYQNVMTGEERARLATLIYYPQEKLAELDEGMECKHEWYRITLFRLIEICQLASSKYTRSKVRKTLPKDYAYIIEELLNTNYEVHNKKEYYDKIISTIIDIGRGDDFIIALCHVIQRLVIDHLHIVGDIFDRGPRADIIMDSLMDRQSVDIQWGNHDVLWMGAAAGSRTCIAAVLSNSITYNNLEVIEIGYGISLRPLALFANEVYKDADTSCFQIKTLKKDEDFSAKDLALGARMHKAIAVILFKLEGQILLRHPEYNMSDRLLLDKIDFETGTVLLDGIAHPLLDTDFPTIDPSQPYALSHEEAKVMEQLKNAFIRSEKLQRHTKFLYSKGGIYKCYNGNLLFHGCIPMNEDGSFMSFSFAGQPLSGQALLDYADALARQGYYAPRGSEERRAGMDFLWFLWCGRNSPLFGRDRITTFERRLVADQSTWKEAKNPYYYSYDDAQLCLRILREFGLEGPHCHIVNGHVPVRASDGESPIKAGGRLIVIDGGFCRAYQPTTGIAGYTMIYNSWGIKLASHAPFVGRENAIAANKDIISTAVVFERMESRIRIAETDTGALQMQSIHDLKELLAAYQSGEIKERHTNATN